MDEDVENYAQKRENQVTKQMIRGQSKRSKPITIPKSFSEKVREDSIFFLKNLVINAEANR